MTLARNFALDSTGRSNAARMAMMAMTTKSSINVKAPFKDFRFFSLVDNLFVTINYFAGSGFNKFGTAMQQSGGGVNSNFACFFPIAHGARSLCFDLASEKILSPAKAIRSVFNSLQGGAPVCPCKNPILPVFWVAQGKQMD
jgi:hypothetical protein